MILAFFLGHVYLSTAGHTPLSHLKAMITGWEDVESHSSSGGTQS
jgi:thiosulfate reductase cytochrome b subunit